MATPDAAARMRAVVSEHHDSVWRSLRRLGMSADAADDATQQVFCVFARRMQEVACDKEKTFLFGVALRVAQSARRTLARRREVSDEAAVDMAVAIEMAPDEQLDAHRARAVLDALLEAMPLDLRAVFVLYEVEEMTMIEIATALDVAPGTVASRLRRARELFARLASAVKAKTAEGGAR
jgi:RNA polymerase sigma-70 factor (ECF subfamily)